MTDGQLDLIDGTGLAEQAGRIATLREIAAATIGETERSNTRRAFAGDWLLWSTRSQQPCSARSTTAKTAPTSLAQALGDAATELGSVRL
jgi:hypothetical protein